MTPQSCRRSLSENHSTMTSLWMSIDARKSSLRATLKRPGHERGRRTAVQFVVIASLSLFVAGVVVTAAGFGPLLNTPSRPSAFVISLQVLGSSLLGITGTVWVVGAVLFFKWQRCVKRSERAARLRNRVQLHALAIDVLNRRPQPGDILAPADRQQLLEQLRLLDACEKERGSLVTKSNSTLAMSDAIQSPTFDACTVQKAFSNVTNFLNGKCESKDIKGNKHEEKENATTLSDGLHKLVPTASNLPGIYISHFDPSDVDECDSEGFYYDDEPRFRCQTYSSGGDGGGAGRGCTLIVRRQAGGSGFSSGTSLFASQRSLPSSSRGSLRLGDSGWEGDVSRDGSLSTMSRRDSIGAPVLLQHPLTSNFLLPPFISNRRHSASTADRKSETSSTWNFDCQHKTQYPDVHCGTDHRSSATGHWRRGDVQPQCPGIGRGQALDVYFSISTSRSLNDSMYVAATEEKDAAGHRRRLMSAPTDRKRRRRKKAARRRRVTGPELREIWINDVHRQHTDDSDVERRVERVLYEIDHSVTDSVDESKIQSPDFEFLSD